METIPVTARVIAPSPFVIVIFEPAVKVATAGPELPPIKIWPEEVIAAAATVSVPESWVIRTALSANELALVPPLATGNVPETPVASATSFHAGLLFVPVLERYCVDVVDLPKRPGSLAPTP